MSSERITFNADSAAVFARLPRRVADTFSGWQREIREFVLSVCPGAHQTSGFRCASYNAGMSTAKPGPDYSKHLFAGACDFKRDSVSAVLLRAANDGRFVITDEPRAGCVDVSLA